jgi:uncharacterized protein with HEPN domain
MNHPDRVDTYLSDIIDASDRILLYTDQLSEEAFLENRMVQDAVIRNFEVIGEASARILRKDPEFAESHPELPLHQAYGMRNFLAHEYENVILARIWSTVRNDVPAMRKLIVDILES